MCKIFTSLILLCIIFHPKVDCDMQVIFPVILSATTLFVPSATDCPEHHYNIDSKQFTWPQTPSTDLWIPSDCLDEEKRLIFRRCLDDVWTPSNVDFESLCKYENIELPRNDCPNTFTALQIQEPSPSTICLKDKGIQFNFIVDRSVCIQDNIVNMEQSINEQTEIIARHADQFTSHNDSFVLGARWRYPAKEISKNVNYDKEDVELHDVRCGRFGLPLKFNSDDVRVNCTEDVCDNMCLYLDPTTTPSSRTIDKCSEYVIAKPEKTFLHQLGCPSGYYRIEWDYVESNRDSCISIKMFPEPIAVSDLGKEDVVQSYCNGSIMPMTWGDDLFVFRELSDRIGLSVENNCLFGLRSNEILQYSDWDMSYASRINLFNFNWDKTMNYSRIITPGVESYLAVKPNGQWTWAVDTVSCIVCMASSPIPLAELQLNYNILERKLELEVTHQEFLFKEKSSDLGFICFSLYREVYKANLTVVPIADGKYLIEDVGIGQYWCSGHNAIDRLYRSTDPSIFFAYGIWFSFYVERKCATACSFSPEDVTRFVDSFSRNNGFVAVKGRSHLEHDQSKSDTEYSFTVLLSLTLYSEVIDNLVTNLINLTDYQLETVAIYQQLKDRPLYYESNEMNITLIQSTEYCLHESTLSIDAIIWQVALLGETISPSSLCPSYGNGLQITRTCSGNYVSGTFWDEAVNVPQCHTFVSQLLLDMYVDDGYSSQSSILENVKNLLEEEIEILLPLDVFLTSRILQKVTNVTSDDLQNIFSIYNSLMQIDENYLQISALLNSTNILLEVFDKILSEHIASSFIGSSHANSSIHSPLIKTFIFNPMMTYHTMPVTIGFYRPRNATDDDFTNYSLRYILGNETFHDLMLDETTDKDLVVASYVPMDALRENITVSVTVFFNDKLFQSTESSAEIKNFKIPGKIINTKLFAIDGLTSVPNKIPIVFESKQNVYSTCGYWSFRETNGWSSNGCNVREIFVTEFQQLAVCECPHSTHIGYLIGDNMREEDEEMEEIHDNTLAIVTVIISSFSFFPIFAIFLTAVLAKKWQEKLSSRILIHFAAAITCEMFLMILVKVDRRLLSVVEGRTLTCVALSVILHYSVFIMFVWMLIIVYLQFKRQRKVSWGSICGWVITLLPVIIILIADHSLNIPMTGDVQNICYPTGWHLYLGLVVPIILIFVINCIVFASVLISLHRESKSKCMKDQTKTTLAQIVVSASLFITFGLTWIFGLFSEILQNSYSLFSYLFCITATIQGLLLLLNIVVFDSSVRSFWLRNLKKIIIREVRN